MISAGNVKLLIVAILVANPLSNAWAMCGAALVASQRFSDSPLAEMIHRSDGPIELDSEGRIFLASPEERKKMSFSRKINFETDKFAKNVFLPIDYSIFVSPNGKRAAYIDDSNKIVVIDGSNQAAAEVGCYGTDFPLTQSYNANLHIKNQGQQTDMREDDFRNPRHITKLLWAPSGEFLVAITNSFQVEVIFLRDQIVFNDRHGGMSRALFSSKNLQKAGTSLVRPVAVEVVPYEAMGKGKQEYIMVMWEDHYFSIYSIQEGNGFGAVLSREMNELIPAGNRPPVGAHDKTLRQVLREQFDIFFKLSLDIGISVDEDPR